MDKWLGYYHPSTTVFVDDQQAFLSVLKNRLPQDMLALFFENSQVALDKIVNMHASCSNLPHVHVIDEAEDVDLIDSKSLNLKLSEISRRAYEQMRFSEISVLVVDQMMPNLDGIKFCRKLIDCPIKKIMLTANKDRKIAVEAFNEGIIDYFLEKDSPDLINRLTTIISRLQKDYFYLKMKSIFQGGLECAMPIVTNNVVIDFLSHKMNELQAKEFYLLDQHGSVVFIMPDGSQMTLAILSEGMMDFYAEIAQEHGEASIAHVLSERQKLLFLSKESDHMRPAGDWDDFLFDAAALPGESRLFYALVTEAHRQPLNIEQIYSQNSYQLF